MLLFPFQSNALPSHIKITVNRTNIFEDSFQQVGVQSHHVMTGKLGQLESAAAVTIENRIYFACQLAIK